MLSDVKITKTPDWKIIFMKTVTEMSLIKD